LTGTHTSPRRTRTGSALTVFLNVPSGSATVTEVAVVSGATTTGRPVALARASAAAAARGITGRASGPGELCPRVTSAVPPRCGGRPARVAALAGDPVATSIAGTSTAAPATAARSRNRRPRDLRPQLLCMTSLSVSGSGAGPVKAAMKEVRSRKEVRSQPGTLSPGPAIA
jgi:hypothetical protein